MSNEIDNSILGANIRQIRQDLNLTQEQFAEKLNVSWQYLSRVENGKVGISLATAINICNLSECSHIKLFKDIIKSPNTANYYELLSSRDKFVIDQMIQCLLNAK